MPDELLPVSQLISLAKEQNLYLGKGNPENRLRYFIKTGLLPHMQRRKNPASGRVEGYLPVSILLTLKKIEELQNQGYGTEAVKGWFATDKIRQEQTSQAPIQQLNGLVAKITEPLASTLEKVVQSQQTQNQEITEALRELATRPPSPTPAPVETKPYPRMTIAGITAIIILLIASFFLISRMITEPLRNEIKSLALKLTMQPATTNNYYQTTNNYNNGGLPVDENGFLKLSGISIGDGNILLDSAGNIKFLGKVGGGLVDTETENLLLNPGFEVNQSGKPTFWDYALVASEGNTFVYQDLLKLGLAHFGQNSTKFYFNIGSPMSLGLAQERTKLTAGRTYTLSGWIKGSGLTDGTVRLGFGTLKTTGATNYQDYHLSGSFDWKRISYTFTATSDNFYPFFEARGYSGGSLYLDDAALVEGTASTLFSTTSTSYLGNGSLTVLSSAYLYPTSGSSGELGQDANRFRNAFLVNANLSGTLTVDGLTTLNNNLGVGGAATVSGNVILGSDANDTVSVKGRINTDLIPALDNTYNLGSATYSWANLYVQNIYGSGTGTIGYWQRNNQALAPVNITDDVLLGATATASALIKLTGTSGNNSWINTGNVGIGTTSPAGKLDITSTETNGASLVATLYKQLSQSYTVNPSSDASYASYVGQDLDISTQTGNVQPIAGVYGNTTDVTVNTGPHVSAADASVINLANYGTTDNLKALWPAGTNYGTVSGFFYGLESYVHNWSYSGGTGSIGTARAGRFRLQNVALSTAGGPANMTTAQVVYANLDNEGDAAASATIGTAAGFYYDLTNAAYGTITNSYGLYLGTPSNSGTISNHYGIYLADQTVAGSTNNFAIYSAGGTNYFAGNVGIGTTVPGYALDVNGQVVARGAGGIWATSGSVSGVAFTYNGTGTGRDQITGGTQAGGGAIPWRIISGSGSYTGGYISHEIDGNEVMRVTPGNVGIGTTSPGSKLQVAGNITPEATGTRDLGSSLLYWANVYANNVIGPGTGTQGYWQRNANALSPSNITDDILTGATSTASALIKLTGTSGNNSWINTGNVGIGTTAPGAKLQINTGADATIGQIIKANSTTQTANLAEWQNSSGTAMASVSNTGALTLRGSNSLATLGNELITNGTFNTDLSNWTVSGTGTGWTWSSGTALHTVGSTETLSQTISVTSGTTYYITFTKTGSAGSFSLKLGTATGKSTIYWWSPSSDAIVGNATGSVSFTVTPSSDFNGSLDNISVKALTAGSDPVLFTQNSDGSTAIESRTGGSGLTNLGFGLNTLKYNYAGSNLVAIGSNALVNNLSGTYNIAIGGNALLNNLTGAQNTVIGGGSAQYLKHGSFNTVIGQGSLNNAGLVEISDSTAVGVSVMQGVTSGSGAVGIGTLALNASTNINSAIAIGVNALRYNSGAQSNTVAIGGGAGQYAAATNDVFLGYQAGAGTSNYSSSGNIFLGYQAGYNETGSNKLYIENSSSSTPLIWGDFNTNVVNFNGSVGIGTTGPSEKLDVNGNINIPTTSSTVGNFKINNSTFLHAYGTNNVFMGLTSGNYTLSGGSNVGIGTNTLKSLTSGGSNMAVGTNALSNNQNGTSNTAVGAGTLQNNTSGGNNTAMGDSSLITNVSGGQNIAIGASALGLSTGSYNVALGYQAGYSNTGSSSVFLGNRAGFYETGSNKLFIDNALRASEADGRSKALIYGIFDAAVANQYLTINGQLQVTGTGNSYISGNVGIGTTSPLEKLDVSGNATVSGNLTFYGGARSIQNTAMNSLTIGGDTTGNITLNPVNAQAGGYVAPAASGVSDLGTSSLRWNNIYANTLQVYTSMSLEGDLEMNNHDILHADQVYFGSANPNGNVYLWYNPAGYLESSNDINTSGNLRSGGYIRMDSSGNMTQIGSISMSGSLTTPTSITSSGNIQGTIFTSTIAGGTAPLSVVSNTKVTNLNADLLDNYDWSSVGTNILPDTTGTKDLGSTSKIWNNLYVNNVLAGGTSGTQGWWQRNGQALSPTNITDDILTGATSTASALIKLTGTSGNDSWINTGNVGIGTTGPLAKLDVSGTASAAGNLSFSGARSIVGTSMNPLTLGDGNTGDIRFYSSANYINSAGNLVLAGTIGLPNSNTITGASGYTQFSAGVSVGGATSYYINNLGTANLNAGTFAGLLTANGGLTIPSNANLTVSGVGGNGVASSLIPTSSTYNLGSSGSPWGTLYANNVLPGGTTGTQGWWQRNTQALSPANITDDVLLGATATASALIKLTGTATNNSWFNTGNVGIGLTNPTYKLDVTGTFRTSSTTTFNSQTYTWPGSQTENFILQTNGTGGLSWVDPSLAGASTIYWTQGSGILYPKNSTVDVLIGGSATDSAKFAFINVNDGTPTASVSAGTNGAAYLTATGTLATTAKQNLTIGSTDTGNVTIDSGINTILADSTIQLSGTNPTISATATNSTLGLAANGNGTLTLNAGGTGDIQFFSSANRISSGGNLTIAGTTTFNSRTYTWPSSEGTNYVLSTSGSGGLSWSEPGSLVGGTNLWNQTDGLLSPKNSTVDMTIGGTATTSAKFAFMNVNSGNPTASISGNLSMISPTGANPATSLNALNGGTFNLRTSVGGDAGLTSRLFVTNAGNMGVGVTNPSALFSVGSSSQFQVDSSGNISTSGTTGLSFSGSTAGITFSDNSNHTISASSGTLQLGAVKLTGAVTGNNQNITGIGNISPSSSSNTITGFGTIGSQSITDFNGSTLTLNGTVNPITLSGAGAAIAFTGVTGTNQITTAASRNLAIMPGGNVGIGTTAPATKLQVTGSAYITTNLGIGTTSTGETLRVHTDSGSNQSFFTNNADSPVELWFAKNYAGVANWAGIGMEAADGSLRFTGADSLTSPHMVITDGGYVGIGTTSPAVKLDVAGAASVSGNLTLAGGARTIAGTAMNALTLGDAYTGNVQFFNGSTYITSTGALTLASTASLGGNLSMNNNNINNIGTAYFGSGNNVSLAYSATYGLLAGNAGMNLQGSLYTGNTERLDTSGNLLAIGSITMTGTLTTPTSITSSGNVQGTIFTSTVTTGTAPLVISSQTKVSNLNVDMLDGYDWGTVGTDIIPSTTSQYDLGSTTKYWDYVYANNVVAPASGTQGYWQRNTNALSPTNISDDILTGATATASALIKLTGTSGNNSWINTGNVGIGTTAPGSILNIVKAQNASTVVKITNTSTGIAASAGFYATNDSTTGLILRAQSSSFTTSGLRIANYGTIASEALLDGLAIGTEGAGDPLVFGTFANERMRIDGAGNVGIGTTAPTALLDVAGTASVSALTIRGSSPGYIDQLNGNDLRFRTSVGGDGGITDRMILTNAGNVGIGTTAPGEKLQVSDGTYSIKLVPGSLNAIRSDDWGVDLKLTTTQSGGTANSSQLYLQSTGNVGIGTTAPGALLALKNAGSEAVLGSELLTDVRDRDFSGDSGNWSGTGWTIGTGVATHVAGANNFVHTLAPTSGHTYQIKATVVTTTAGTIAANIGGVTGKNVGQIVGTLTQQTWVITAVTTGALQFVPNAAWAGTLDDITVMEITSSSPSIALQDSGGYTELQIRSGGNSNDNTLIGLNSGRSLTTGNSNVFLGSYAGMSDTTGYRNVFIGESAGLRNTSGYWNTAVGEAALRDNLSGNLNTAIGGDALIVNTTGYYNTATGYEALGSNTAGYENTALGGWALEYNNVGYQNTAIGNEALYRNTSGTTNTALGYFAGHQNQTGSGNVFLGYNAGYSETGSNKLYIDNSNTASPLIWGDFNTNVVNFNGTVGIGTTAPTAALDVSGTASVSALTIRGGSPGYIDQLNGNDLRFRTSVGGDGGLADRMILTNAGNVGIGTTAPGYALDVNGAVNISSTNNLRLNSGKLLIYHDNNNAIIDSNASGGDIVLRPSNGSAIRPYLDDTWALGQTTFRWSGLRVGTGDSSFAGNVGIGTTAPGANLHIVGTELRMQNDAAKLSFYSSAGGTASYLGLSSLDTLMYLYGNQSFKVQPAGTGGLVVTDGNYNLLFAGKDVSNDSIVERLVLLNKSGASSSGIGNRIKFQANNANANTRNLAYIDTLFTTTTQGSEVSAMPLTLFKGDGGTSVTAVEVMRLTSDGNVGIGTTAPTAALDVSGTASVSALTIRGGSPGYIDQLNGNDLRFRTSVGGSGTMTDRMILTNAGLVGIGTTSPVTTAGLTINTPSGQIGGVRIRSSADTRYRSDWGITSAGLAFLNSYDDTGAAYKTMNIDASTLVLNNYSTGNVGIGTTAPAEKLDVNGNIKVKAGTYQTDGAYIDLGGGSIRDIANNYDGTNIMKFQIFNTGVGSAYLYGFRFQGDDGTIPMQINAKGGNVGIGTTEPGERLHVYKTGGAVGIKVQGGTSGYAAYLDASDGDSRSVRLQANSTSSNPFVGTITNHSFDIVANNSIKATFTTGGNVGIGTTAPGYKLDVSGNADVNGTLYFSADSTASIYRWADATYSYLSGGKNSGYWSVRSDSTVGGSSTWNNWSDQRLKKNITSLGNSLDVIKQLRPVSFKWNENYGPEGNKDIHYGFIAQEVEQVLPTLVTEMNGYKALSMEEIIPFLVEGVNTQQDEIASLSAQIDNLNLTSTGDLQIVDTGEFVYDGTLGREIPTFELRDATGELIQRAAAFSKATIANLRVGAVSASRIITDALQATHIDTEKIVSPLAEIETLNAKNVNVGIISPLSDSSDVIVRLPNPSASPVGSKFGQLLVQNDQGETVASVDSTGKISANSIEASSASIAGTLYADEVVTKHGKFGDLLANQLAAATVSAQYITSEAPVASDSSGLLSFLKDWSVSDVENDIKINSDITILGHTSLASTTVAGDLSVGAVVTINELGIQSFNPTSTLFIQPFGLGSVDILAGKVTIDKDGNMNIEGNLAVKGTITTARLATTDMESTGSAKFADLLVSKKLTVATASATLTETASEQITDASIGKATILAGSQAITIKTPQVTGASQVFVTPTSPTDNKVLYVTNQTDGQFRVEIDSPIDRDIQFNWWLVN